MPENTLRELDTPLARELAENILHQHDMHGSIAAMNLWHQKYAEQDSKTEEGVIGKSLFRDAIIQFVGCFDKTAKFPLSAKEIYEPVGGLPSFQWFQDTRDAYAAHKFGSQRQCIAGMIFDPKEGVGIGIISATYKGQPRIDGPQMIAFMRHAAVFLDEKVARLRDKLLESVQTLTAEQIGALSVARVRTLAKHETKMSRASLQKLRSRGATSDQFSWTVSLPEESKTFKVISHTPTTGTEKPES